MPGENLTREEAQARARLLTVDSYEIDLDLSGAQEGGTFRSVTTVRFDVAEEGADPSSTWWRPPCTRCALNGDGAGRRPRSSRTPGSRCPACWPAATSCES